MQLDVDIEPTLRFPHMTSIDKQMDESEGSFPPVRQTDRQTDRKRRIRAHRTTCTGGLKNPKIVYIHMG